MPVYTSIMTVAFFGSLGLPGMSGFIGEALALMGAWRVYPVLTIISAIGILLGAAYFLWTIQRMFLGNENPEWEGLPDINGRELLALVPLGILVVVLGVLPWIATNLSAATVDGLQVVETMRSLAKL
jgi:NADH-quinone oxidoreductase subunit M